MRKPDPWCLSSWLRSVRNSHPGYTDAATALSSRRATGRVTSAAQGAVGTTQLKNRSVTQPKINPALLALFKGQQGPKGDAGSKGDTGSKGETGGTGQTGQTGPTYGESHGVFAEAMTPQMDMGPASTTVTTPTAGKLYVFGYNEGATVTCTAGTGVYVGLFVDETRVPGLYSLAAGVPQNLSFSGVTSTPVAAGSHKVVAKAQCLTGGSTVNTATTQFAAYGVIVLGS
jgi:hypothetical protein